MNRRFGKNDVLLIAGLFVISVMLLIGMSMLLQSGERIVIFVDGKQYGTYSLQEEQEIVIKKDGTVTNVVVISDGHAHMRQADCPDQLCVRQKNISKDKESIICLPNQVVVMVEGGSHNEVDSVAR